MSIEELETKLTQIKESINQRKQEALDKGLFDKIQYIVRSLGERVDWGRGETRYKNGVLLIELSDQYLKVIVGSGHNEPGLEVFSQRTNGGEVTKYIPGDWVNSLDNLQKKAAEKIHQDKIDYLKKQIKSLESEWKITPEEVYMQNAEANTN